MVGENVAAPVSVVAPKLSDAFEPVTVSVFAPMESAPSESTTGVEPVMRATSIVASAAKTTAPPNVVSASARSESEPALICKEPPSAVAARNSSVPALS